MIYLHRWKNLNTPVKADFRSLLTEARKVGGCSTGLDSFLISYGARISLKVVIFSTTFLEGDAGTGFAVSASLATGFDESIGYAVSYFLAACFTSTGLAIGLGYSGALSISTVLATGFMMSGATYISFTTFSYLTIILGSGLVTVGFFSGDLTLI